MNRTSHTRTGNGEKDFMEDLELISNLSDDHAMKKHYNRFAKQLSDWYCKGKTPALASQDTRFTLELQKQKLQSFGLDMQIRFGKPSVSDTGTASISYDDSVFENYIIGAKKRITTNISNSGNEIFNSDADGALTIIMQNPKKGGIPSPETAMCCPNCGIPSTLGKLESGCEYCSTKFLMDELYPKVMHLFIKEDGKPLFDTKQIKKYILCFAMIFLPLYIAATILNARMVTGSSTRTENFIYAIPASAMIGVIFGTGAWFIVNTFESIKLMGKNSRGGSKMVRSLVFCHKMHELDPTFSTEYFRDKSMSLLKFMIYSRDPRELTVCRCDKPIPERLREIVDITYRNSGVTKYSIRNGVCNVSLTFYTDSLHYRNGKIHRQSDKIHMSLRKVIKKPTDLGFSVMAVSCPSCSASFDAAKVRECPFCGNVYPLEENEWVVTDIGY